LSGSSYFFKWQGKKGRKKGTGTAGAGESKDGEEEEDDDGDAAADADAPDDAGALQAEQEALESEKQAMMANQVLHL
jgi:hypothetical protein